MGLKTTAIVLAAGMGSRMGLHDDINKCALPIAGTTPVRHTVSALLQSGVSKITVVVGYASDSVIAALSGFSGNIEFVNNEHYNHHGCNYSLSCAPLTDTEKLIIAEGDSLLCRESIAKLISAETEAASLIRSASYIDYSRSVIAVGNNEKITRYAYDTAHSGLVPQLSDSEIIIGESMQLWSFSGDSLKRLKELLSEYNRSAQQSETAFTHSGVYSINQLSAEIEPVFSDYPENWINLNTKQDLIKAEKVKWLVR